MRAGFSLCSISIREKPAFINWEPCNENRFFPVRNTTQGKPCFHYRHGFAVCLLLLLGCAQGPVATSWVFDRFLRNNLKKTCHFIMGRKRTRTTEKNSANSDQNQSSISCPDPESITAQRVTNTDSEEKGLWPQPCSTFRFENSIFRLFWTKSIQKSHFSNFSCRFLNSNNFFQFELWLF